MSTNYAGRRSSRSNREGLFLALIVICSVLAILVIPLVMYAIILSMGAHPVGMSNPEPIAAPVTAPAVPTPLPPVQAPQPAAPAIDFELPEMDIQPWQIAIVIVWVLAFLLWWWTSSQGREFAAQAVPWVGAILLTFGIWGLSILFELSQSAFATVADNQVSFVAIGILGLVTLGIGFYLPFREMWWVNIAVVIFSILAMVFVGWNWYILSVIVGMIVGLVPGFWLSTGSYAADKHSVTGGVSNKDEFRKPRRFSHRHIKHSMTGDKVSVERHWPFVISLFGVGAVGLYHRFVQPVSWEIWAVVVAIVVIAFIASLGRMRFNDAAPNTESHWKATLIGMLLMAILMLLAYTFLFP